jgi:cell division protein FtsB
MKKEKKKQKKSNSLKEVLVFALVIILGLSLYQLYQRVEAYMQAQQELSQAEQEKMALEREELENQRMLIQSDSASLMEKLAREQLGMVKPGETVYRLSPSLTPSQPVPSPSSEGFLVRIYKVLSQFFSSIFR